MQSASPRGKTIEIVVPMCYSKRVDADCCRHPGLVDDRPYSAVQKARESNGNDATGDRGSDERG